MLKYLPIRLTSIVIASGLVTEAFLLSGASVASPQSKSSSFVPSAPICYIQNGNGTISDLSQLCQQDDRQKALALTVQKLEQTKECSGCILQGANLTGMQLREANLSNANLERSQMSKAFLPFSDFRNATLSNADLRGANLTGANFMGADLSGANLAGAELGGASLEGAKLTNTIMPDGSVHP